MKQKQKMGKKVFFVKLFVQTQVMISSSSIGRYLLQRQFLLIEATAETH